MRPVEAKGHKRVTVNATDYGFDSHRIPVKMKYLIFSILRYGVEIKCDVEFRSHTLLNTECLLNSAENEDRSFLISGSRCLPCYVRYTPEIATIVQTSAD